MPLRIVFRVVATAVLMSFLTTAVNADQFHVEPTSAALSGPHERLQMVATEPDSASGPVDVTWSVTYRNLTPEFISVSPTGVVTPLKSGMAVVQVKHGFRSFTKRLELAILFIS